MAKWYVKSLSKLTGISVQTLHHYDRIGLLKPSLRLSNGYRLYSEDDLLKLQRIIALKFFGFELIQIKALLTNDHTQAFEHFSMQVQVLEEKSKAYASAGEALKSIISDVSRDKSIPWETIIKLIEVYKMTKELEKTWAGNVFSHDELKQYAKFEEELKTRFTPKDWQDFTNKWLSLIEQVKSNLKTDPKSDVGFNISAQIMSLVGGMYGNDHANLRHSIWENGFKKGKMEGDRALDPEVVGWLDKAIDNYWWERIYSLFDEVENSPASLLQLKQKFADLMTEMFGNSEEMKQEAYMAGIAKDDPRIGPKARGFIRQFLIKK